jgi:membrane fusion protein (multidrug efflux system)
MRLPPPRRSARTGPGALLAVAALALACGSSEAGGPPGLPPPAVEVTRIEPELLRDVATFSGQLDAEHSVMLKPETEGVVEAVAFRDGQDVSKGDVLIRLRNAEQEARLREAEATLQLAQEEFERAQQLVSRDAVSKAAKDRATAQLGVARARVDLARVELERTEIRAPFDGVVGAHRVDPGDFVDDKTELVQVDAVDRLQVTFALTEQAVALGTPKRVEVRVLPFPGEVFPGEVFYVSPTVEPATRRVYMKAWVPNPDRRLRAGLFANVDLEIAHREGAILVPESAVVFDRQGTYVWRVDEEDVPTRVPIDLGLRKDGRVEVSVGLHAGDRIVVAGTHKVMEGKKVRAEAPSATGQARREPKEGGPDGAGT